VEVCQGGILGLADLGQCLGLLGYVWFFLLLSSSPSSSSLYMCEDGLLTEIGIVCPLYGISLFLPSIIRGLGYTSSTAQLLTVPIYITASVLAVVVAWYSDRVGKRYPFILVCLCIMAVGFIMCIAGGSVPGLVYAGVFIAACALYPAFPGNITWLSNNLAGSTKRATGQAIQIAIGNLAGGELSNM
jgi:MFS family permease